MYVKLVILDRKVGGKTPPTPFSQLMAEHGVDPAKRKTLLQQIKRHGCVSVFNMRSGDYLGKLYEVRDGHP